MCNQPFILCKKPLILIVHTGNPRFWSVRPPRQHNRHAEQVADGGDTKENDGEENVSDGEEKEDSGAEKVHGA